MNESDWESTTGQPVIVEDYGLWIDGEMLSEKEEGTGNE